MKALLIFTLYLISGPVSSFDVIGYPRGLMVIYRNLSLQDAGSYRCGETRVWNHDVNLKVNSAIYRTTTTAPTTVESSKTFSSPVIISISVCVVLLLIGGLALIFCIVIHRKKQGLTPSFRAELNTSTQVSPVASNNDDPAVYANVSSPTNSPDEDIAQPLKDQDSTYTTVSFRRNPASPAGTSLVSSKEDSPTEYAAIRHLPDLE
ncbi:hypothetical protein AOLI_G00233780 [Acnodon oligacanthus]